MIKEWLPDGPDIAGGIQELVRHARKRPVGFQQSVSLTAAFCRFVQTHSVIPMPGLSKPNEPYTPTGRLRSKVNGNSGCGCSVCGV